MVITLSEKKNKKTKNQSLRIHQAAKKMGFSSSSLVQLLRELGFSNVKSHMSVITDEMMTALKEHMKSEKNQEQKKYDAKKKKKKEKKPKKAQSQKNVAAERRRKEREERKKRRQKVLAQIDENKVRETVKKTLAKLDTGKKKKKSKKKVSRVEDTDSGERIIYVPESYTVSELAENLDLNPTDIIKKCIEMGYMVTINQRLDFETIKVICEVYDVIAKPADVYVLEEEEEEPDELLEPRAPIITIMGHVDHGKTTLLDYIRQANVVGDEEGGITQHIGAYQVDTGKGQITFIDTPGHKAFTAMRARGATVTDIVVLVVAANDSVMPQTVEAINHARAAGIPIIVAINKVDLADANVERTKKDLSEHKLLCEDWGGDTLCIEISALKGEGVQELLEMILLQAEMMELTANYERLAKGIIVEGGLSRGLGSVATVLIQQGTLRKSDPFVAGTTYGRVRQMFNERNEIVESAEPSSAVLVTGFDDVPKAGDSFFVTESDSEAKQITSQRNNVRREELFSKSRRMTLSDFHERMAEKEKKILNIVLKTDYFGSAEAIKDLLQSIKTEDTEVEIKHAGVGTITENDILLAAASDAIVIGFNVKLDSRAREAMRREQVEVKHYSVIYELHEDIYAALEGLLAPDIVEKQIGTVEVRQVFRSSKYGDIAGSYVKKGVVRRNAIAKVYRDGSLIAEGKVTSLKRFKEDVSEVQEGYECGLTVDDAASFEPNDTIEVFEEVEVIRRLKRK
ncbi:MAG: translation initiation factor IF-2 [Candidatus Zixiibacteriota bacterium]